METDQLQSTSMLDHALGYIAQPLNWRLCKIRPSSKAPVLDEWNSSSLSIGDAGTAAAAWQKSNYGIGLVHESSKTGALDVDDLEWTIYAFNEFGIDINIFLDDYPRIKGKDGRAKIIFRMPEGFKTIKLVWPPKNEGAKPITVFELRGYGGQDVLPPSIHPDTKLPYEWINSPFDLKNGVKECPDQLKIIWQKWNESFKAQFESVCPWLDKSRIEKPKSIKRHISNKKHNNVIGQFNEAHDIITMLESYGYKKKGKRWLSPTSSSSIPGVVVFNDDISKCYSHHASDPLNDGYAHDAFDLLVILGNNGDFNTAIKEAAKILGIENVKPIPEVDISELIAAPFIDNNQVTEKAPLSFPIPILNEIMEWMELYEDKPTRSISMQGVIALVSVICGRIYLSNRANDSSLFLMTLAETGRGKGYPAKAIRKLLIKSGFGHLIKGGGNTSASAVFSALRESPCHIQITDEIGKQYQAARKQSNGQMQEGLAQLTSIYSLTGDIAYPKNRSTEGLTKIQAASLGNRFIMYPSLTLFGFATLEQVIDNLSTSDIDDGFLNRQIIVISDDERLPERDRIIADVPENILQWVKDIRSTVGVEGNFTKNDSVYDMEPSFMTVTIDDDVYKLFKDFRNQNELLEDLDSRKLAIRWNENAMRMSTGFAIAANPWNPVVTSEIALWCMDYIKYHGLRFINIAKNSISDNDFHRLRQQVLKCIENQKTKGISYSKIKDFSRIWASSSKQLRDQVITTLIDDDLILKAVPTAKPGKGRPATMPIYYSTKYMSFNTEAK